MISFLFFLRTIPKTLSYSFVTVTVTFTLQECVENLFSCLCTVLLQNENQKKFLSCEGMELMVRCMYEQKHSAGTLPSSSRTAFCIPCLVCDS